MCNADRKRLLQLWLGVTSGVVEVDAGVVACTHYHAAGGFSVISSFDQALADLEASRAPVEKATPTP